jgi:hypothetical protein
VVWPLLAFGQQSFPARRSAQYDPSARTGQFDLRVRVDGSADFWIQGSDVRYVVLSGRPPLDAGTEFTQPIPRARFTSFTLEKRDGRGRIELREEPGPRNNYTALIHIEDREGGEARYHATLRWVTGDGGFRGDNSRIGDYRGGDDRGGYRSDDPSRRRRPWDERVWRGEDLERGRIDSTINDRGRYNRARFGSLEFSARVDQTVVLRIHDDDVWAETRRGRPLREASFRFTQALPQMRLQDLQLERLDGRGEIRIIEQPSERNNYTAAVLINDPEGGADQYRFRLRWRRF